jgi:hypothetical protein
MFLIANGATAMAAGTTMTGKVIGYNGAVSMGANSVLMEVHLMLALSIYGTKQQKLQLPRF